MRQIPALIDILGLTAHRALHSKNEQMKNKKSFAKSFEEQQNGTEVYAPLVLLQERGFD